MMPALCLLVTLAHIYKNQNPVRIMKTTGPKVKLSRRLGIPLTPKAARIMERKPHPPGQHGRNQQFTRGRMSDYKRQLTEKQRLRAQYNISERQMRNYFRQAERAVGNTANRLVQLLESRLDAVVHRGGLAPTIYAARQFVSHGHVLVNGRRVNIASYQVKVGDVVSIRQKSRQIPAIVDAVESATLPSYLDLSPDDMSVKFLYLPDREEVPVIAEVHLVIEFYSR